MTAVDLPTVLDAHFHLDFLPAGVRAPFLTALRELGVTVVAQTVTPSGFARMVADAQVADDVAAGAGASGADAPGDDAAAPATDATALPSLGFHPWFLGADPDAELEVFAQHVHATRFIGEIGLDHSPRRLEQVPAPVQERALRRILEVVCEASAGRPESQPTVLSLHAVRSAGAVVKLLKDAGVPEANVVPMVHWFSGSSDELTALMRLGGYVSINPTMLQGKRGRAYVTQVPGDRLLLETDLPPDPPAAADTKAAKDTTGTKNAQDAQHAPANVEALAQQASDTLRGTFAQLCELRGPELVEQIARTQHLLYGVPAH